MLTDSKKECQKMIKRFMDVLNNTTWTKCNKCDDEYKLQALNEFGICNRCHDAMMKQEKKEKQNPNEINPNEVIDKLEVTADETEEEVSL